MHSYFIFLNKPIGLTSQQCLSRFKKKLGYKKVGHHGTLDPFATGLLLVGVNEASKYFQFVDDTKKTYEATLCLGVATDTLDHTGAPVQKLPVPELSDTELNAVLLAFVGKLTQTPPMYSAIKQDGVRLYKLARQGIEVERKSREIEIFEIKLLSWQRPLLKIAATVSRGTYIRVLAEQIAEKLGTCAHLVELTRTTLCEFDLSHSISLEQGEIELFEKAIPIENLLSSLGRIDLTQAQAIDLLNGKKLFAKECRVVDLPKRSGSCDYSVFFDKKFIGVAKLTFDANSETQNMQTEELFVPERLMNLRLEL